MAKRFGRIKTREDWMRPVLVGNALELLDREIPKYKNDIDVVHLSFMTDPFMFDATNRRAFDPIENLTLKIIGKLNRNGIRATTLTKGICPEELATFGRQNHHGITLVSLKPTFQSQYEPFAAPVHDRIEALRTLHEQGLKTWVSIEPYPTPNMVDQDLDDILKKIGFVDTIVFGKLNYNKAVSAYAKHEAFYTECSRQLIAFCKSRNIRYYIKKRTPGAQGGCHESPFKL